MRLRSIENILSEIEELINRYQIANIGFLDDFFTVNAERTSRTCEALKKLKIKWLLFGSGYSKSRRLLRGTWASRMVRS